MKKIIINENDANKRLDKFICKTFPNIPESLAQKYIRKKRIKLNGKKAEHNTKLSCGDVLELYINDEFFEKPDYFEDFKKSPKNLDIIYEDENIILVNKKSGLIVHPDKNIQIDCLINRIKNYLFAKGEYNPSSENSFAPALVNRLDRNTSGIVIAAKNAAALNILNEKMKARELEKKYICIILGNMAQPEGILRGYLEKNSAENKVYINKKSTRKNSEKTVLTKYSVIAQSKKFSLLEVTLLTGRTHQIRAHFASVGHPILGDSKYGQNETNRKQKYKYQALCSYKLKFKFETSAGILDYLNEKEFSINPDNIWFVNDFYNNLK